MIENKRHRIEDIKRHLYDVEDILSSRKTEGTIHPINHQVEKDWKPEDRSEEKTPTINYSMKKPPTSIFKKFFIGAVIFFFIALALSLYMFYGKNLSVSNDNIDITVLGNAFTKGGDELPLQVEITNRNNASLELANLIVSYPRGASNDANDLVRIPRDSIGTIKPGATVTRNIKVSLFGEEKSTRNIKVSLEYHPPGSNAIFTKEKEYTVVISSAPLSLNIDAPTEATSDQEVSIKITASLNTALPAGGAVLQVTYPNSFVFSSATPAPSIGNSIWPLSSLTVGNPVVVTINGRLIGQDGDQQVFHAYAGATSASNQSAVSVVYNSLLQTITITKPFLETHVIVNNQDLLNYTAGSNETIRGQISWINNLSTRVTDAQIIANFSGNAFDKTSIDPLEGFYDSSNSRIVWDKNSIPDLGSVEPGASGNVTFTFKSIPLVGSSVTIKNPQIALDVSIKGRQPGVGSTYNDINNFSKKVIRILSDFQITSVVTFSSGSLPPKAESETIYNVTWTLSNSANNISGASARSVLPIYIKWIGKVGSSNEKVTYNEVTREVIWNIGAVSSNTGFSSNREASFAISLKPSISQVQAVPQLMKDVFLSGTDSFTNTIIKNSYRPITTSIINDPNFKSGDDRVVN